MMTATASSTPGTVAAIPIPLWSWAVLLVALVASFLMLQENGLLLSQWETLHEFFHDGRHALGFPCD